MSRQQQIILVVLIIFIIGGSIFGLFNQKGEDNINDDRLPLQPPSQPPKITGYTPEVPSGINLTPPVVETPASPGNTEEKLRIFEMRANQVGYEPKLFTVNKGDTVQIKMASQDGDYDFYAPALGLYQFAKRGEARMIAFGALNSGSFDFECRDHCPAGKIIKGSIIVLP